MYTEGENAPTLGNPNGKKYTTRMAESMSDGRLDRRITHDGGAPEPTQRRRKAYPFN